MRGEVVKQLVVSNRSIKPQTLKTPVYRNAICHLEVKGEFRKAAKLLVGVGLSTGAKGAEEMQCYEVMRPGKGELRARSDHERENKVLPVPTCREAGFPNKKEALLVQGGWGYRPRAEVLGLVVVPRQLPAETESHGHWAPIQEAPARGQMSHKKVFPWGVWSQHLGRKVLSHSRTGWSLKQRGEGDKEESPRQPERAGPSWPQCPLCTHRKEGKPLKHDVSRDVCPAQCSS